MLLGLLLCAGFFIYLMIRFLYALLYAARCERSRCDPFNLTDSIDDWEVNR